MKEMVKRAARTFVEAALGYIAANVLICVTGSEQDALTLKNTAMALVAASVASGIAAVLNMPKKSACKCESADAEKEAEASEEDNIE